jgi:hypothetical protein
MAEYYKDHEVRVTGIQQASDVSGAAFGPRYKGLPREVIDNNRELGWMLQAEQSDVVTFGSEEGEFVWVLAEVWDDWRGRQPK